MSLKNIFLYGQVGTALDGFRDSEIGQQSANKLLNWVITEMGTLRVAKQYTQTRLTPDNEPVLKFLDTKYGFYIIITKTNIHSVSKSTNVIQYTLAHGLTISTDSNASIFNDFLALIQNGGSAKVFAFKNTGELGTSNFIDTIKLPFLKLTEMSLDYYKVFNPTIGTEQKLSPELMRSYGGDLEVEVKDGKLYISNLNVPVDRIYKSFKAGLTKDDITSPADGHNYLIFRNYKTPDGDEKYFAGNTAITFSGETADEIYGSSYFTGASPNGAKGTLRFGAVEDFKSNIVDFLEYQSRLVICSKEKLYFSKVLDYNEFVPGTSPDEPFFLKLSPIDGNQPVVMKMSSGNGIYVTSEKGIMVVGYDTHLTPQTSLGSVFIAGNSEPTKASAIIENDFYYIDKTGLLRCILMKVSGGKATYSNEVAEKYKYDRGSLKWITRGYVNEQNACVCTSAKVPEIIVYNRINDNVFRNYSLEFDNSYPVFGFNEDFVSGCFIYTLTDKNYPKAKVINNMPYVKSPTRGLFLMDFEMDYSRIVLNVLSPIGASKGVKLNGIPLQNLQRQKGEYNIYDYNGILNIINLDIEIETNQTSDPIEIKGINYSLRGGGL